MKMTLLSIFPRKHRKATTWDIEQRNISTALNAHTHNELHGGILFKLTLFYWSFSSLICVTLFSWLPPFSQKPPLCVQVTGISLGFPLPCLP